MWPFALSRFPVHDRLARVSGSSRGPYQFFHGLQPLTFLAVGSSYSWPEIAMTKDAPLDPLSHMVLFETQCSESPLSLSTLIALCLCGSSVFSCLVEAPRGSLFSVSSLLLYCGNLVPAESLRVRQHRYLQVRLFFLSTS